MCFALKNSSILCLKSLNVSAEFGTDQSMRGTWSMFNCTLLAMFYLAGTKSSVHVLVDILLLRILACAVSDIAATE